MYNLAIIGCGRISYKHVQAAVDNCSNIRLVAVCDTIKERAKEKAELYCKLLPNADRPAVYTDYSQMISMEKVEIASICTESGYHAKHAIDCVNHGVHVIVEKPIALSTRDADSMIESANRNNVKLCVSHQNRFNPSIQKLRNAVESGRFGRIIAGNARILWNRGKGYYEQAPWRGTYSLDGGCLMNQCIHNIDLLQWMLGGEIKWINGDISNNTHPYIEAEDYGSIQLKFSNGSVGNIEGTVCVYPENLEETLTIIGVKGIAVIGGLAVNKIEVWRFEDGLDTEEDVIKECFETVDSVYGNGHSALYADFIKSLKQDLKPYISGNEGKKAMEIVLAAYQSNREEKRIYFPVADLASINYIKE